MPRTSTDETYEDMRVLLDKLIDLEATNRILKRTNAALRAQASKPQSPRLRTMSREEAGRFVVAVLHAGVPDAPNTLAEVVQVQKARGQR